MSLELDVFNIMLQASLVVKLVLLTLFAGSILSWTIIIKKYKQLKLIQKANKEFLNFFRESAKLSEISSKVNDYPHSAYATMYSNAHAELMRVAERIGVNNVSEINEYFSKTGMAAVDRSLKQGVSEVNQKFEFMLSILASIGSISPFVGLFGTVWGIIGSFHGLASGGGATIELVAPGIAEALVATAIGLVVAIPAVWFFNHFNNENVLLNGKMESFGQEVLNVMERSILIPKK